MVASTQEIPLRQRPRDEPGYPVLHWLVEMVRYETDGHLGHPGFHSIIIDRSETWVVSAKNPQAAMFWAERLHKANGGEPFPVFPNDLKETMPRYIWEASDERNRNLSIVIRCLGRLEMDCVYGTVRFTDPAAGI